MYNSLRQQLGASTGVPGLKPNIRKEYIRRALLQSSHLARQMFYGLHIAGSPLPVAIIPASPDATTSTTLTFSSFVTVATAGLASEIVLTMRDAGANVVDCKSRDLSVWMSGQSYVAADVKRDTYGACKAVFSALEVKMMIIRLSRVLACDQ